MKTVTKVPFRYDPALRYLRREVIQYDLTISHEYVPIGTEHNIVKQTATGERHVATASSAAYARKIARMLNADHEASLQD